MSETSTDVSVERCVTRIHSTGVIAIVRGTFAPQSLPSIAEALRAGGVDVIEVTLNSTEALKGIEILRREFDDGMLIGTGTVRTANDVTRSHSAGAQFVVAPNFDPASVRRAHELNLLHVPGVFTASETQAAFAAGCSTVKLFPANLLGPAYLKALRAPLDDVAFVPTGGISSDNVGDYVKAGAVAVGVGSALVTAESEQDLSGLTRRAIRLIGAIREARATLQANRSDSSIRV